MGFPGAAVVTLSNELPILGYEFVGEFVGTPDYIYLTLNRSEDFSVIIKIFKGVPIYVPYTPYVPIYDIRVDKAR
jgi:hypothetical protein